jgi:hypothetical protein
MRPHTLNGLIPVGSPDFRTARAAGSEPIRQRLNLRVLMTNMKPMANSLLNEEDQFGWLAREFTADLNLSEDKLQEFADLLKEIAGALQLSPSELMCEVQRQIPVAPDEPDEGDWWKGVAA